MRGVYLVTKSAVGIDIRPPNSSGRIPREFGLQATRFHEQATIYLLVCSLHKWLDYDISRMLDIAEKYCITLRSFAGSIETMTARIFKDVAQRGIDRAWDTLAITANACVSHIRPDANALRGHGHSLGVSLLVLYLFNGEIFLRNRAHNDSGHKSLDHTSSDPLEIPQPEFDVLPISAKALPFLNHCRFPPIQLHARAFDERIHLGTVKEYKH